MTPTTHLPDILNAEILECGYFPNFVCDTMAMSLADEPVLAHLVHQEALFSEEEVGRHLSVLVLTPSRLLVGHTDDYQMPGETPGAVTTIESVALRAVKSVTLSQSATNPESFGTPASSVPETWLVAHWGAIRDVDLEPAGCADPDCDADHGYVGSASADDLTLRASATVDGAAKVHELVAFGCALQRAVGEAR